MSSHRLVIDKLCPGGHWFLSWDEQTLSLKNPDGYQVFELPTVEVHRVIDLGELGDGRISFATSIGDLRFKRQAEAAKDMYELVVSGFRIDPEFRENEKRRYQVNIRRGMVAFVVCGSLFVIYCCFASRVPGPSEGHWLYSLGLVIHLVLLLLIGLSLGGAYASFLAIRQLKNLNRIEEIINS